MSIETLLRDEIREEFEGLKQVEIGSKEYTAAVDGLTKLVDRAMEMEKFDLEFDEKVEARKNEEELSKAQMEEERKDRRVKNGIAVVGIVLPSALTIWGTLKSLKFEETGTVTTIMGRGFINKLLPRK